MTHLYALVQSLVQPDLNAQATQHNGAVAIMVETIIIAFIVCETISLFLCFLLGKDS